MILTPIGWLPAGSLLTPNGWFGPGGVGTVGREPERKANEAEGVDE